VQGVGAIRLKPEQLDDIKLDLSSAQEAQLFETLGRLLPERKGWTSEMRFYGDEKSNDAHVSFDRPSVATVQFRIDASDISLSLIGGICALARRFDCVLVARAGGAVIQPSCEAVMREVLQSPATRFVRDPEAYLSEAARLDTQDD
jgi:hypothetical protein